MDCDNQKALVYSIQHYCIHDGPGIRTMFFFKGCQMYCGWCANPESKCKEAEIAFFRNKCRMCGACTKVCESGAINLEGEKRIDLGKCTLCGDCVYVCPNEAYSIFGEYKTCAELVEHALKDRAFYRKSGGGVTLSGGEPTLNDEFLLTFLKELRANGIHTAIETNGYIKKDLLAQLASCTNLFLYDIKHMDTAIHEKHTGLPNDIVIDNMRRLVLEYKADVVMRVPLIPGFNDDDNNLLAMADFATELSGENSFQGVHLLKFHGMAQSKYEALGQKYEYAKALAQNDERLNEIKAIFEEKNVKVQIGG